MDIIQAKEKFVFNLLNPEQRAGKVTILYIVYRTIEANASITLNQLKWILDAEYMIPNDMVTGAVAALTSKSLFNCVSRWQPPRGRASQQQRSDTIHLRMRKESSPDFLKWYADSRKEFPELDVFIPPIFVAKTHQPATGPIVDKQQQEA